MKAIIVLAGVMVLLANSGAALAQDRTRPMSGMQLAQQGCICSDTSKTSNCCALKSSLQACVACAVSKGNPRAGATGWCQQNQAACRR